MRSPVAWNRSRAIAVSVTLVLHVVTVWWLLELRFELPEELAEDLRFVWVPVPVLGAATPDRSHRTAAAPSHSDPRAAIASARARRCTRGSNRLEPHGP